MEPISPELVLVDPELARRARALLDDPGSETKLTEQASRGRTRSRARGRLVQAGAWLVIPSVVLNLALLFGKASRPVVTGAPAAPSGSRSSEARRERGHALPKATPPARRSSSATHGVLAAKAHPGRPARHPKRDRAPTADARAARRTLEWPATPGATSYNIVVWRGRTRMVDLWPKRPRIDVTTVACGGARRLDKGRYLWFVYPVLGARPAQFGPLVKWGVVEITRVPCAGVS